jgi:hypothetical protein
MLSLTEQHLKMPVGNLPENTRFCGLEDFVPEPFNLLILRVCGLKPGTFQHIIECCIMAVS